MWIEIFESGNKVNLTCVTPLAGVWIEILPATLFTAGTIVTPLAGVWIEIVKINADAMAMSHSPCGSVD